MESIKINKNLVDWEWFSEPGMVSVWIHILLEATTSDYDNMGLSVRRGQLMINSEMFAAHCGVSNKVLRDCIGRLVKCGFIRKESTRNYTLLTVNNYESFIL